MAPLQETALKFNTSVLLPSLSGMHEGPCNAGRLCSAETKQQMHHAAAHTSAAAACGRRFRIPTPWPCLPTAARTRGTSSPAGRLATPAAALRVPGTTAASDT